MPTEFLLTALATCFAMALAWAARKRGFTLPDLGVRASADHEGPRLARITVEVQSTADRADIEPLMERARAFCFVSNTLRQSPVIDYVIAPSHRPSPPPA